MSKLNRLYTSLVLEKKLRKKRRAGRGFFINKIIAWKNYKN